MVTFWAALQHFANEDGSLSRDGEPFWLVSKVCGTHAAALAFDDGDPDADEFKAVGVSTEAFLPDVLMVLAEDYDGAAKFVYEHLAEMVVLDDGETLPLA